MGIRSSINAKRVHLKKLGPGGLQFLKLRKTVKQDEVFSFPVKGYSNLIHLRNKTSDLPTFYQCIFNAEYDIPISFVPQTILDLGANIGLTTAFFKHKYPEAKIFAVEPEKSNYRILQKNTEKLTNITLYNNGIWHKNCDLIVENRGLGHYGYIVKEAPSGSKDTIPAISINDIVKSHNLTSLDIVKIDIEGSEKEVFSENTDNWLSITKVLIIEFHDRMTPGSSKSVFKALENFNYEFAIKGENIIFYMQN
jgi:FkbM family methyltransferase